ncbi:hypothetical protein PISL3812_07815 [Talaromyces islandicus]|uniref:Uncharacterized protein n=1 Tax=Talaromyces islandicus TaxID=28573 RepID=A0A0U1M6X4_TALIS|nr:hypothetical protein PISL3812_07815 [Talaromyces islandicus]
MSQYNYDEEYVDGLFHGREDPYEGVDRYNIALGSVPLTGNVVEDRINLEIARHEQQTPPQDHFVLSSVSSHGHEMGLSSASQTVSSQTRLATQEQNDPDINFDWFEHELITTTRLFVRSNGCHGMFGKPYGLRVDIRTEDDFDGKLVDFFQSRDDKTACDPSGVMTNQTVFEFRAMICCYKQVIGRQKLYNSCQRTVTLKQQLLVDELRRIKNTYTW